ncbi:FtsW/RodA/SpoVE family cell cycle protein [Enterococcus lemanii]|uniref:Probable peptidoglycan glycosyltransferase FtsW n=1 Tax=Enterococcus lemanii TaxID=1159752 RepID=A0ABV9MRW8_9ENTE|nr:FtsW/RodA/SpoVE family cell cycle protein [Enterococcus lemanii]MBM7708661.1 cell division protein FtsW [Enterococcus lemanii]
MPKELKKRHLLDWGILLPYLTLSIIGLMMVYSTTSYVQLIKGANPAKQAISQLFFWLLSLTVIMIIYKMKVEFLRRNNLVNLAMMIITVFLILAFFFDKVNGSWGWIPLPIIGGTIQPVEFLKFIVIWYFSVKLASCQNVIHLGLLQNLKGTLLIFALQIVLIMAYPDFGNAAVIVLLFMAVLLTSGISYYYTLLAGGLTLVGSVMIVFIVNTIGSKLLPSHVVSRFLVFRNPFIDEYGDGHQMIQGYYAMFNGGIFGRGLGNSIQKNGFLKFAHTDFAFAIVVEELGLLFAIVILGLLFYLITRIILIGIRSDDPFNSMMCLGIGVLFLVSVFINLGGITGIIPLTGITFPFISQGGSSLLMFSICIGFVLNISADERKKQYRLK